MNISGWTSLFFSVKCYLKCPRRTVVYCFGIHSWESETNHSSCYILRLALFSSGNFFFFLLGRQGRGGLDLLQNLDSCRVPYELLFKVCSWTAVFAKPKGTQESHHWSGQSPSINWVTQCGVSGVSCKRHERMSPSFASWTDLFLNNLEKDSKHEERTWLQIH